MQLYCGRKLDKMVSSMGTIPAYSTIIQIMIKQQIHELLRRLADTGEESVVLIANVHDGSRSALGSPKGENFMQEPLLEHTGVVSNFFKHFTCHLRHNELMISDSQLNVKVIQAEMQGGQLLHNSPTFKGRQVVQSDEDERSRDFSNIIRVKSESNQSIDQTVSRLVKRILSESKKREAESYKSFDSNAGLSGRKRSNQYLTPRSPDLHFENTKDERYGSHKRRRISEFFPAIKSPPESTKGWASDSRQISERCEASDRDVDSVDKQSEHESNTDGIVIVKTEPESEEYDNPLNGALPGETPQAIDDGRNVRKNSRSDQEQSNNAMDARCETDGTGDYIDTNAKIATSKTRGKKLGDERPQCPDGDESGSDLELVVSSCPTVHIEEDDIDLPFVQDYYSNAKTPVRINCGRPYRPRKTLGYDVKHLDKDGPDGSLQYTPSYKTGHFNLRVRGFSYIRDKVGKLGTVYWKCRHAGCKGRAIKRDNEVILSKDHNHDPDEN
ncbi:uncharacterized protein LOC127848529 isoform X2 [Dreissena polymorpha]|uniref:FLYWCH-type domain-containing protein n=2 Tax=Dreissena polymorpha TaxID=45954 RepID=A0A9D4DDU0_DREPO|nr:uncharacterized protein LOC127848529 isoform X2 [Dreissena polymorpha]KAH3746317.1 hypothetical protein DPMN_180724 [Dreissena polymorpha]